MKLDWKAQPIPGKSMFNLDLGTAYVDAVSLFKTYEISNGVIQLENSLPMRLVIRPEEAAIILKTLGDGSYDWQSDVAMLHFINGSLKLIRTYLNEPYSYRGLICGKIGLGGEVRAVEEYFTLEYDPYDEGFYASSNGKLNGLELCGASCDLSVDQTQIIGSMGVTSRFF